MDAHKQIRIEVVGYRCAIFKLDEVVGRPCHFDSQPPLFEQPGDLVGDRQIDDFLIISENAYRAGVFTAVSGVDYNGPGYPSGYGLGGISSHRRAYPLDERLRYVDLLSCPIYSAYIADRLCIDIYLPSADGKDHYGVSRVLQRYVS